MKKNKKDNLKEKFDARKELNKLTIKRLFLLQKLELDRLSHYIVNDYLYDKNDLFLTIQEIISINLVITKKIHEEKIN